MQRGRPRRGRARAEEDPRHPRRRPSRGCGAARPGADLGVLHAVALGLSGLAYELAQLQGEMALPRPRDSAATRLGRAATGGVRPWACATSEASRGGAARRRPGARVCPAVSGQKQPRHRRHAGRRARRRRAHRRRRHDRHVARGLARAPLGARPRRRAPGQRRHARHTPPRMPLGRRGRPAPGPLHRHHRRRGGARGPPRRPHRPQGRREPPPTPTRTRPSSSSTPTTPSSRRSAARNGCSSNIPPRPNGSSPRSWPRVASTPRRPKARPSRRGWGAPSSSDAGASCGRSPRSTCSRSLRGPRAPDAPARRLRAGDRGGGPRALSGPALRPERRRWPCTSTRLSSAARNLLLHLVLGLPTAGRDLPRAARPLRRPPRHRGSPLHAATTRSSPRRWASWPSSRASTPTSRPPRARSAPPPARRPAARAAAARDAAMTGPRAALERADWLRRSPFLHGGAQGHKEWWHFAAYAPGLDVLVNFSLVDDVRPEARARRRVCAGRGAGARTDAWDGDVERIDADRRWTRRGRPVDALRHAPRGASSTARTTSRWPSPGAPSPSTSCCVPRRSRRSRTTSRSTRARRSTGWWRRGVGPRAPSRSTASRTRSPTRPPITTTTGGTSRGGATSRGSGASGCRPAATTRGAWSSCGSPTGRTPSPACRRSSSGAARGSTG